MEHCPKGESTLGEKGLVASGLQEGASESHARF